MKLLYGDATLQVKCSTEEWVEAYMDFVEKVTLEHVEDRREFFEAAIKEISERQKEISERQVEERRSEFKVVK